MKPIHTVIAVDPGTAKCGVAVVQRTEADTSCKALHREVVPTSFVAERVTYLVAQYGAEAVLVGDATGSKPVRTALADAIGTAGPPLIPVPEAHTSRFARERYLRENPPASPLARLLPLGLRTPDRPYDDYVAVLLAENYFATHKP